MNMSPRRRKQASRRSSWRARGSKGGTLLLVITLLGVGGMYLAVSAKAAEAGRQVLQLERRREDLLEANAELTTQLVSRAAPDRMMALASELGFRPAGPNDVEYLTVEGLAPADPFVAPQPTAGGEIGETTLSPAYTETLGDWFSRVLSNEEEQE